MREIEYRAWLKDEKKIGEVMQISLNTPYSSFTFAIWHNGLPVGFFKKDEIELMQFTGLCDKNGKKIFEGDIGIYKQTDGCKIDDKPMICVGKVIWNKNTSSFGVEGKDKIFSTNQFDYFPIKDFEVIGNIHDNSELLEKLDKE